jgi:aryl-alcohol dehydrogenase-like predicted oxidoreductase
MPRWKTSLKISRVALGCWPIAGMTSLDVNEADSLATIEAAVDAGINFFDTAYCYGVDGISERLLGQVASNHRPRMIIATKCGVHWDDQQNRVNDASPQRLLWECDQSLQRLGIPQVDLMYLHSPDPRTPVSKSAEAFVKMLAQGKAKSVGVSNASLQQIQEFHAVCPVSVVQFKFNMLQQEIQAEIVPWCQANQVAVVAYWPLMKGLFAGKLRRNHVFDPGDKRQAYPMFSGDQWNRNQDFLDELDLIAADSGVSLVTLVIGWTASQPGITSVLCGAKRPAQIQESANALNWKPDRNISARVDQAIKYRMQRDVENTA